ncbi:hypothetical protein F4775DRAFT_218273 [Biscogniauxia sp. FL1348]|nr:hypothetical protein F4775DRAFT_218273 [Biscogniauxia sp. FL1348]
MDITISWVNSLLLSAFSLPSVPSVPYAKRNLQERIPCRAAYLILALLLVVCHIHIVSVRSTGHYKFHLVYFPSDNLQPFKYPQVSQNLEGDTWVFHQFLESQGSPSSPSPSTYTHCPPLAITRPFM